MHAYVAIAQPTELNQWYEHTTLVYEAIRHIVYSICRQQTASSHRVVTSMREIFFNSTCTKSEREREREKRKNTTALADSFFFFFFFFLRALFTSTKDKYTDHLFSFSRHCLHIYTTRVAAELSCSCSNMYLPSLFFLLERAEPHLGLNTA